MRIFKGRLNRTASISGFLDESSRLVLEREFLEEEIFESLVLCKKRQRT